MRRILDGPSGALGFFCRLSIGFFCRLSKGGMLVQILFHVFGGG